MRYQYIIFDMRLKPCRRSVAVVCGFILYALFSTNGYAYIDDSHDFDFSTPVTGDALGCLALNIYHEGRGESARGQAAIAAVTMNRVRSKFYPNSVCEVVWQRKQFSWTNTAAKYHAVTDFTAWAHVLVVARLFLDGAQITKISSATHYHADTVKPYWIADSKSIGKIGSHYFYIM